MYTLQQLQYVLDNLMLSTQAGLKIDTPRYQASSIKIYSQKIFLYYFFCPFSYEKVISLKSLFIARRILIKNTLFHIFQKCFSFILKINHKLNTLFKIKILSLKINKKLITE